MTLCITIDQDGQEIFREQRPKRWVPRGGWERGEDGAFYKFLGNPLFIVEPKVEEVVSVPKVGSDSILGVQVIHPQEKISYNEFKRVTNWVTCCKSSHKTAFYDIQFETNILGLTNFDTNNIYKAVEINHEKGIVKVWLTKDHREEPDFYVIKPFKESDSGQNSPIAVSVDDYSIE